MELDEFVRATLTQIISGVDQAKKETGGHRVAVRAYVDKQGIAGKSVQIIGGEAAFLVEFDVEVTAATKGGGKLSVGVASFGLGAGGEASRESTHSNRIRFAVPIDYQTQH